MVFGSGQRRSAYLCCAAVAGKRAAQKRVDGRYAILIDWRGVSGDQADRSAHVAKAQAHKKQLQKRAIEAAGAAEALAAAEAAKHREKVERLARKEQERKSRRHEKELLVLEVSSSDGEDKDDLFRDFSDVSSEVRTGASLPAVNVICAVFRA